MKKTLNINLGGLIFHIDEDAFNRLEAYLGTLKRQFAKTEGGDEIVNDVELRMAELFRERTSEAKEVVNLQDVDDIISILGQPEDYLQDEEETNQAQEEAQVPPGGKTARKIFRDSDERIIGGVAAGFAAYFNIDPVWMRIIFIALLFSGFGIPLYIILWIVVPKTKTTADKLRMRGEPVTITNIERAIREEAAQVGRKIKDFSDGARNYDYQRTAQRTGGFFNDLGRFIMDLLRLIFKLIFKILGAIFLIVGFIVLASMVFTLFTGGLEIDGAHYGLEQVLSFTRGMMASETHYNALVTGVSMLLAAPLFILIYYGIRLLFKVEPLNKQVRNSLALLAFVGFALTVFSAVKLGLNFKRHGYFEKQETLSQTSGIIDIAVQKDSIYEHYERFGFDNLWMNEAGQPAFQMVELDVRASKEDYSYLSTSVEARGEDYREAQKNARNVTYNPKLDSSRLEFPVYYQLEKGAPFRAQEIEMILYLKPGDTIRLTEGTQHLIYDIKNLNNYWDWDMVGHSWTMTEHGLLCADCAGSEAIMEKLERKKQERLERAKEEETKAYREKVETEVKLSNGAAEIRISERTENILPLFQIAALGIEPEYLHAIELI